MAIPKPEPEKPVEEPKPEEAPVEIEEEEIEDEEESGDEYDSDGELIVKPKKEKVKEPTPPPKEATPPPKEPTPVKEPSPIKEPTPPPKEPVKKRRRSWLARLDGITLSPEPEEEKPKPETEEPTDEKKSDEIEKPVTIYRPHRIREFRKNAQVPLEIVKRLLSQMIKCGSPLKLSCCVSEGDARIKVDWTRDGEPVELSQTVISNVTEDGRATLEFKKIDYSDAGRYKCTIKTKKGHISSECDVKVYGDPEEPVEDVPPTLVSTITGESVLKLPFA